MKLWNELKSGTLQASSKAMEAKDIARLNLEIAEEERQLEKLYTLLGRQYFETQTDTARDGFPEIVSLVEQRLSKVRECRERIQTLKGGMPCPNCGAMMSAGEMFCAICGTRRPQAAESRTQAGFCPKCGKQVQGGLFCAFCGEKLADTDS